MNRMITLCVVIFSVLFVGCSYQEKSANKASHFAMYLKNNFGKEVNETPSLYYLVPASGCGGCGDEVFHRFWESPVARRILIVSKPTLIDQLKYFDQSEELNVIIDTKQTLDRQAYLPFGASCVVTYGPDSIETVNLSVLDIEFKLDSLERLDFLVRN